MVRALLLFLVLLFLPLEAKKQTICLNMIVKDEKEVIRRSLGSVKGLIDYWVIVDTGSSDGTQKIIKEFMKDIPGELHERPWVNFAHNRNEALSLAKGKGDYLLFIDADEELIYEKGFKKPVLDKDFYHITCAVDGFHYVRKQLINHRLDWRWEGVVHEIIYCPTANSHAVLPGITNIIRMEGCRSRDPKKYHKDAEVLVRALEKEPGNPRYTFYLAQSYRDSQQYDLALETYKKRAAMGGVQDEVFWCLYQAGLLQEALNKPGEVIVGGYIDAYKCHPERAEPLFELSRYYNKTGQYFLSYLVAKEALQIATPQESLIANLSIYNHGILLEYAFAAFYLGKVQEAYECSLELERRDLPPDVRNQVKINIDCCLEQLKK